MIFFVQLPFRACWTVIFEHFLSLNQRDDKSALRKSHRSTFPNDREPFKLKWNSENKVISFILFIVHLMWWWWWCRKEKERMIRTKKISDNIRNCYRSFVLLSYMTCFNRTAWIRTRREEQRNIKYSRFFHILYRMKSYSWIFIFFIPHCSVYKRDFL